jgi:hypothetical protein
MRMTESHKLEYEAKNSQARASRLALVSFVLGVTAHPCLVSGVIGWVCLKLVPVEPSDAAQLSLAFSGTFVAVILGCIALLQIRASRGAIAGHRMAIAGIVIALFWAASTVLLTLVIERIFPPIGPGN